MLRRREEKLAEAERTVDDAAATKLTMEALAVRRTHCHPLSLLRYYAESAAIAVAARLGDHKTARNCNANAIAFLEMALSHVPWHPILSLERMQLAALEAHLGHHGAALQLLDACVPALLITHGHEHQHVQRAKQLRAELRKGKRGV